MKALGKRLNVVLGILSLTFALFLPAAPCFGAIVKEASNVMGTTLDLIVSTDDPEAVRPSFTAIQGKLQQLEELLSEWKQTSELFEVNRQAGITPVVVSPELFNIAQAGLYISQLTGGAFDITWAAMWGVWDFREGKNDVPSPEIIQEKLKLINFREVQLDPEKKTIFLQRKGMVMGLGGIAKGYAVDIAAQILLQKGINNFLLKAGGDLRVQGTKEGKPWRVAVPNPRVKNQPVATLQLSNISVSTSGDYERYFIKDGIRYHHIIDLSTGYPARKCRGVTILAPDTMTSDALSTSVFVLGPQKGIELVEKLPGVEAVIVDSSGKTHTSSGIDL